MDRPRRRRRGRAADGPRWRRGYIATPRREGIVRGSDRRPRYLRQILSQLKTWLDTGEVQRLVIVVTGVETGQTLERWVFGVHACAPGDDAENSDPAAAARPAASVKEITKQIQAIIRQITASVTFLPLLEEACAFDLLVYTRKRAQVPGEWEDTDPQYIADGQEVKLRSFTTSVHTVDAAVSYKENE